MNDPRDYLPAKYKKISLEKQISLAKPIKNRSRLAGLLILLFLAIGISASYILIQQNQDNRQQAAPNYIPAPPEGCGAYPDTHLENIGGIDYCIPNSTDGGDCGPNTHRLNNGDPDKCYHETCRDTADGGIICGYVTDLDACTNESMGGDWCDNPNTDRVETCSEVGLIRCRCGGTGNGWWVIGSADSCGDLCEEANAVCEDCPPDDDPPDEPPLEEKLNCGEFGCNSNADCDNGLTCQPVNKDGVAKKICAKGENQLFCAAQPNVSNCCESQAMPVCASIEMLDVNLNPMTGDDDEKLKSGDEVRFRCSASGNQSVNFNYEFRILIPGSENWLDISNQGEEKDLSKIYALENFGQHIVQGRICVENECQVWEAIER